MEKNGQATFNFRMNEKELRALRMVILMSRSLRDPHNKIYDSNGDCITDAVRSMHKGVRVALNDLAKAKNHGKGL